MSIAAIHSLAPAPPKPPAPATGPASNMAAELIARSSVAGMVLTLLASAAPPAQGRQVDAQA